ncbi:acyloxyacyl hydrolase [Thiohalorhabdus sp.]|uniref:acyloxyacyl hydrolase n=1 Tax=Thiohalorhabdus sp. TaxID=3094134 RepID=UPI002FC3AEB3
MPDGFYSISLPPARRSLVFEVGSGPVYLSKAIVGVHNLGNKVQFRSHIGWGFLWGPNDRFALIYRYSHTSNAGLGHPNPGLNVQTLHMERRF